MAMIWRTATQNAGLVSSISILNSSDLKSVRGGGVYTRTRSPSANRLTHANSQSGYSGSGLHLILDAVTHVLRRVRSRMQAEVAES
jgi:hypothetical protein